MIFLMSISLFSQKENTTKGVSIKIKVIDFTNDKGVAIFTLFKEDAFFKKPIKKIIMKINNGESIVTFNNVP